MSVCLGREKEQRAVGVSRRSEVSVRMTSSWLLLLCAMGALLVLPKSVRADNVTTSTTTPAPEDESTTQVRLPLSEREARK